MDNLTFYEIIQNNSIEKTLQDQAAAAGVDLYECNLNTWKALLQEAGALLFPKTARVLKVQIMREKSAYNIKNVNYIYDLNKINIICDHYIYLSHKYNKLIAVLYFSYLLNIDNDILYSVLKNNNRDNNIYNIIPDNINNNIDINIYNDFVYSVSYFNTLKIKIYKKLKTERENNLKEKCFEAPGAVGAIAIGNTENGWNLTPGQKSTADHDGELLSIDNLPDLLGTNNGSPALGVSQGVPYETNTEKTP